jgi:hypothetical protein
MQEEIAQRRPAKKGRWAVYVMVALVVIGVGTLLHRRYQKQHYWVRDPISLKNEMPMLLPVTRCYIHFEEIGWSRDANKTGYLWPAPQKVARIRIAYVWTPVAPSDAPPYDPAIWPEPGLTWYQSDAFTQKMLRTELPHKMFFELKYGIVYFDYQTM